MEIIENNYSFVGNKNIIQSHTDSDRLFVETSIELLRQGHQIKFKAPGVSMYPTICDGDLITVQPIKTSDVIVGDIILYRRENRVVAHRVVNIQVPQSSACPVEFCIADPALCRDSTGVPSPQYFFTARGDAAPVLDNPVGADQILGKVVLIERNSRRINPYSFKVKLHYKARRLASHIKKLLIRPSSTSA